MMSPVKQNTENRIAEDEIEASVAKVVEGKKPYAVTYPESANTSITFSLAAWLDEVPPQVGQIVILTGVRKFREGWRARSGRPVLYSKK
jgi:hypothetical protein